MDYQFEDNDYNLYNRCILAILNNQLAISAIRHLGISFEFV